MPYTSLDRLTGRFGATMLVQLTDRGELSTGVIDADTVAQAIAGADATINASLAVRYRLPMATVPDLVSEIALAIAIYKLHVGPPDDKIDKEYQQALKDLGDLATGKKLLDVAGVEPETSGASGVVTADRPRDFSPENLRGFI
jgi:phage gp36-like protein